MSVHDKDSLIFFDKSSLLSPIVGYIAWQIIIQTYNTQQIVRFVFYNFVGQYSTPHSYLQNII